jgi:hypothetical protein
VPSAFPLWKYYPPRERAPEWVADVLAVFASVQDELDSLVITGTTSDIALGMLRPGLIGLGFDVEAGKKKIEKIRRPVLFGEMGAEELAYEVDAFHPTEAWPLRLRQDAEPVGTPLTVTSFRRAFWSMPDTWCSPLPRSTTTS